MYGPAPEPLNTIAVPKSQVYVIPAGSAPTAETFTVDPLHAFVGLLIVTLGAAFTFTVVVAAADVHPLLVTVKLGWMLPAVG